MKTLQRLLALTAVVALCGCFQVQDELTIQPDGSGKVTLTVHTELPEEALGMLNMSSGNGSPMYPPVDESEARHFFPPKDFSLKVEDKADGDQKSVVIEASFKDINALLASPYGRAHQLALSTNGSGTLQLRALSGASTLVQAAQAKPEGEAAAFAQMPGLEDAQKKKNEMRFTFRVTLPNAVQQANGAQQNQTVTWAAERAKCKDDAEFAAKLSGVLEAACSSQGLKFAPASPPRLGLLPFAQLAPGKCASTVALPDTNQVLAAARVIPYSLRVNRTVDLSGEGAQPSQAEFTGAIVLPAALAPQRWGEAKLEEATDAKGNSLVPKQDSDSASFRYNNFHSYVSDVQSGDEETDDTAAAKKPAEKPHLFTLSFKAPEWKVKRIAKVKGALELQYLGGAEIIKLTNAVPANLVMDTSKGMSFNMDSDHGRIANDRLTELGLSLQVQMAMVQSGMTMLSLQTSGGKAALTDAQVFDAQGVPWPTTLMAPDSTGGEEQSCQIMVAGKPTPPFSLAVAVGGVGATVSVPILVENVPVGDK